jgi:hypothetical protein
MSEISMMGLSIHSTGGISCSKYSHSRSLTDDEMMVDMLQVADAPSRRCINAENLCEQLRQLCSVTSAALSWIPRYVYD